jgi:fucose 4-O-acetylase-like acetyltransferase
MTTSIDLPDAPRQASDAGSVPRDRMLDVVKAVAIGRVVLWHTWGWAWLSWIPAMPAMFFASGALLEDSVGRRGWWATVQQRVRRLMLPFWVYAGVACVLMMALGWRPAPGELFGWVVPLVDPVGAPATPGLWIPLWYVRAYLWFVLAAGVLHHLLRRFGDATIVGATVATGVLWWMDRRGLAVPLEVGDAVAYSVFVLAGMRYRRSGVPGRRGAAVLAVAAGLAALWTWNRFGPADGVVNRSYLLTVLVGVAGVSLALAFRDRLCAVSGWPAKVVDAVGRRALTIYLWQGLGLVTAQLLVDPRVEPGAARAVASLVVVVVVTAAAAVVFGPVEDIAAGRSPRRSRLLLAVPGVVLAVLALAASPEQQTELAAPMSGRAVVARAAMIDDLLQRTPAEETATVATSVTDVAPEEIIRQWLTEHPDLGPRVGFESLRGAFVTGDGRTYSFRWGPDAPDVEIAPVAGGEPVPWDTEPLAWWSMTKTATAVWLMRAVEAGAVRLDQPLSELVPEAPHAERMTLEMLARHISGIPNALDTLPFDASPVRALEDWQERPRLQSEPGVEFSYSRTGYFLLALALERATGSSWRSMVDQLGAEAGVRLVVDEDLDPVDDVTDPDGRGYRGRLWAAGGLHSAAADGARFFRWAVTAGVAPTSLEQMTSFSNRPEWWFYGIGLMPLCPCEIDGDRLVSSRYGLDSGTGSWAIDASTGATVAMWPNAWFDEEGPVRAFYDLSSRLLDNLGGSPDAAGLMGGSGN